VTSEFTINGGRGRGIAWRMWSTQKRCGMSEGQVYAYNVHLKSDKYRFYKIILYSYPLLDDHDDK